MDMITSAMALPYSRSTVLGVMTTIGKAKICNGVGVLRYSEYSGVPEYSGRSKQNIGAIQFRDKKTTQLPVSLFIFINLPSFYHNSIRYSPPPYTSSNNQLQIMTMTLLKALLCTLVVSSNAAHDGKRRNKLRGVNPDQESKMQRELHRHLQRASPKSRGGGALDVLAADFPARAFRKGGMGMRSASGGSGNTRTVYVEWCGLSWQMYFCVLPFRTDFSHRQSG
jgi:hypothetical protein